MADKRTVFQDSWLGIPRFKSWLSPVPGNRYVASCNVCNSTFKLSNMGKRAVSSHMTGEKHKKKLKSATSTMSFLNDGTPTSSSEHASAEEIHQLTSIASTSTQSSQPVDSEELCETSDTSSTNNKNVLKAFLLNENVTKAEIMWCLNIVIDHLSFRSAARAITVFRLMCPDSIIASKIQLQRTKIGYTIVYGIAPYFQRKLVADLKQAEHLVVGFDESLNKVAQKQQMDIFVRYFDTDKNQVMSRYLTSVFLGHTCATDLLSAFRSALSDSEINLKKVTQISMDGPNVNMKFLRDLRNELSCSPDDSIILDLGSCGIHTMHCAFKAAFNATKWDLTSYLRCSYYLFKDVPARRADYIAYTGKDLFPKKFCGIRWGENSDVAKRAIAIHPHLLKYIEEVEKDGKEPTCKSFLKIKEHLKDPFLLAKLSFFQMMAEQVEPFLTEFQGEAPMAPFLYESLLSYLNVFLAKFVKNNVLKSSSINSIDFYQKSNLKHVKDIEVGFSVRASLKKIKSESSDLDFLKSCQAAFQAFVDKVLKRSPLKHKLTRGVSCLDPVVISSKELLAKKRMTICLETLMSNNWITGTEADKIDEAYKTIFQKSAVMDLMKSYNKETRLDNFWMEVIDADNGLHALKKFVKFVLILSHGNAFVERGFSVNAECILENQAEESLIALRQIHDAVSSAGGISTVKIDKSLIHSARNASAMYKEAQERKKQKEASEKEAKQNELLSKSRMKELQLKKMKLLSETQKQISLIEDEMKTLEK